MKNLILLNRSGMSPEVTCRKGRHAIGSILSRFSLASLICLCMLTVGVGNAWGANVAVGDTLIIENFTGGTTTTTWADISGYNYSASYSSITMKVSGDASSISRGASDAKVVNPSSTPANMVSSHVWLNKSTDGYIEIDNIPLHNVTKFQAHWAQNNTPKVTFYYKFNGDDSWTAGGDGGTSATADATSDEITVTSGKTSVSIKFQRANNKTNQRIDKVHLVVTQIAATKTLSSIAITTAPTKTAYLVGQTFSSTGAVVTATYSDATTATVSATWTPTTGLVSGSNTITASYTEGGVTKTATTTVTGYTVTVQVKDVDGNTLSGVGAPTASATGASITASASGNNYVFKRWVAVTAAGTSFANASNRSTTLTGTPTGNVTIKAEYYKPINITWNAGGSAYTPGTPGTTQVGYGALMSSLTLPSPAPSTATFCGDKFVGWTTEENVAQDDDTGLNLFTSVAGNTTPITADMDFYAVFADYTTD